MRKLGKGLQRFFEFMRDYDVGDIVTRDDLITATEWSESSFDTYLRKNKLVPFLERMKDGRFKVLKHGASLTEADVQGALSQVTPQAMTLLKGEVLSGESDTYELVKQIGQGAVGHVWEARVKGGAGRVAVKVVNPRSDLLEPTIFENVRDRFQREARNGMKLRNQALIRYIDHGRHRGTPFLTMELAAESVATMLSRGAMPLKSTLLIVARIVDCLSYLHEQKCIHRDVKPSNVLRIASGFVLADLGIARWSDQNAAFTSAGTLTKSAVQLGSWYYMAPEQQLTPHEALAESDVYALGVTWYEMLTGVTPPPPPTFAAGRTAPPCDERDVHRMIGEMTTYDPTSRPSPARVAQFVAEMTARLDKK